MGTRGYKIIRFRGRYYRFYNHWDSYPDGYGSDLVSEIPRDRDNYKKWVAEQRAKASEWDSALEKILHVKRLNVPQNNVDELDEQHSDNESEESEGELLHWSYNVGGNVDELPLPSYRPVFNDIMIEWIYVIDLDREIFSIDHGAHLKLEAVPKLAWINALAKTHSGDRLLLPDLLPESAATSLVITLDPPSKDLHRLYEGLKIDLVTPKGINGFEPTRRHETVFCARIFHIFQRAQRQVLSHLLLGWKPDELPFREIAFSILCLASGRQNVSLVKDSCLVDNDAHGCANLMSNTDHDVIPEFVAHMGVGAHLNDNSPGSAPNSSMYWFEGILVHLVARLDSPGVIQQCVARLVQHARELCPTQPVDAVLISIAHVVLVRVFLGGRVQHTKLLPLFSFRDQPSQDPRERFSAPQLDSLLQRKECVAAKTDARAQRQATQNDDADGNENRDDEIEDWDPDGDEVGPESISFDLPRGLNLDEIYEDITTTEPSFFSLALFLDTSTRISVPLLAPGQGHFPTEIYRLIFESIEDVDTHGAWMAVSSDFRNLCMQSSRIIDRCELLPNEATMAYTHARKVWNEEQPSCHRPEHVRRWRELKNSEPGLMPRIRVVELEKGLERDITIDRVISGRQNAAYENFWRVLVGKFRDQRSLLLDMKLGFKDV